MQKIKEPFSTVAKQTKEKTEELRAKFKKTQDDIKKGFQNVQNKAEQGLKDVGGKIKDVFKKKEPSEKLSEKNMQLSFVQLDDPVLERIREELETLDINTLTPIEALMKLNEIKRIGGSSD